MVAVAKARHQPGYGVGRKRGWDRHLVPSFSRYSVYPAQEKNTKATIQSAGPLSHYWASSLKKFKHKEDQHESKATYQVGGSSSSAYRSCYHWKPNPFSARAG